MSHWNDTQMVQDEFGSDVDVGAESQFGLDAISLGMLGVLGVGGLLIHRHFAKKHRHQHAYERAYGQRAAYAGGASDPSSVGSHSDDQSAEMAGLMGPTASNPYGLSG